jgi:hypothetical protein
MDLARECLADQYQSKLRTARLSSWHLYLDILQLTNAREREGWQSAASLVSPISRVAGGFVKVKTEVDDSTYLDNIQDELLVDFRLTPTTSEILEQDLYGLVQHRRSSRSSSPSPAQPPAYDEYDQFSSPPAAALLHPFEPQPFTQYKTRPRKNKICRTTIASASSDTDIIRPPLLSSNHAYYSLNGRSSFPRRSRFASRQSRPTRDDHCQS